ncbi:transcription initiation factor IIB family protein [Halobium salinum]|uniref:Transcription initiation factor IIB n=1 Tax=Halobium salinum TaxID=1364940 RepID=A0ABD5P7E9_9EURY|nr:TFIIB-type zinc ribbon-containing protein [Halobium salinum]
MMYSDNSPSESRVRTRASAESTESTGSDRGSGCRARNRCRSRSRSRGRTPSERRRTCPECDGAPRETADGETACDDCGLVLADRRVDHGPEWRAYTSEEHHARARVGAPTTGTRHDRGLTTEIGRGDRDAAGGTLSPERRRRVERLRTWHQRVRTVRTGERNLRFALSELDRMASALGLPRHVRETAAVVYRRALAEDLIRGRSIEAVATATLYVACRQKNLPRSLAEVTAVSRVEQQDVARASRHLSSNLGLELRPVEPTAYLPRFCSRLDLSAETHAKAAEVLAISAEAGHCSGRSPTGCAAAAVYTAAMLCGEKRTQSDVAAAAGVTEVTIRNRYHEQVEALNLLDGVR